MRAFDLSDLCILLGVACLVVFGVVAWPRGALVTAAGVFFLAALLLAGRPVRRGEQ